MRKPKTSYTAILNAIRAKVGYRPTELRAYVIDKALEAEQGDDFEVPADDALDVRELVRIGKDYGDRPFVPGCAIDVYVYGHVVDNYDELIENIEIRFDEQFKPAVLLTTNELIRESAARKAVGGEQTMIMANEEPETTRTETVCETGEAPYDCAGSFNCCDCGGNDCGCRYCWSCNACDNCRFDSEP